MFERLFGSSEHSTLIESSFRDIAEMLEQSQRMFDHAVAALLDNASLDVDLDKMDDTIDEGERMIRRSVLEHLVVNPNPELVPSLILASLVQDVERIGDFARGIGELIPLARGPREGAFRDELRTLAGEIRPLFELSRTAFVDDDAEKARQVMQTHVAIKPQLRDFTARLAASDLSADQAVVYSGAALILRRIGAHLSNVASAVVQPYDRLRHGDEDV